MAVLGKVEGLLLYNPRSPVENRKHEDAVSHVASADTMGSAVSS